MAQIQSRLTRIEDRLALYRPEDKSEENVHGIGPQIRALNWKVDGWAKTVERLDRKNESLRSLFRGLLQEVRGEKSVPSETKSCRACQGEPIAPWPPASGKGPTHHTCHPGEELDKPILPDDRLNDQPVKARLFDMDGFGVWVRWKNDINNESNLQYLRRLTELAPAMQDFIQGCQSTKSDYSELMDWVDSHIKDVLIEEEQGGPA
jgi:hypothetical protein